MSKLTFLSQRTLSLASVFLASLVSTQASPAVTPEPSTYAVGFGAAVIGFVAWRNFRKSRNKDTKR